MFTLHTDDVIPYSEDEAQCLLRLARRGCRKGREYVRREKRMETTLTDYVYHLRVDTRSSGAVQGYHVARRERKGVGE